MSQLTQLLLNNLGGKSDLFLPERSFGKQSIFNTPFRCCRQGILHMKPCSLEFFAYVVQRLVVIHNSYRQKNKIFHTIIKDEINLNYI
jgi:hypothetical protein